MLRDKLGFPLENLKNINALDLSGKEITDSDIEELVDHLITSPHNLTLFLSNNEITDHGAELLAKLPIEVLDLSHNNISDDGATHLATISELVLLNLNNNSVGSDGARALVRSKSIQMLHLAANKLGDRGAKLLSTSKFTGINIANNQITDRAIASFNDNEFFVSINLSGNNISLENLENFLSEESKVKKY